MSSGKWRPFCLGLNVLYNKENIAGVEYQTTDPVQPMNPLIARFMGPTWGLPGANRTQVGLMLATLTLLSGPLSEVVSPISLIFSASINYA